MIDEQRRFPHIVKALQETPWAILPAKLAAIVELIEFRAAGGHHTDEEIRAVLEGPHAGPAQGGTRSGAVAVIPVYGVISQRMSLMADMSGGTSTERVGAYLQQALSDPNIAAIVLNFDSPGGSVFGVEELGNAIFSARATKPIISQVDSMAASAAYWLAAQGSEIVTTPGGVAGSIGVYMMHTDVSAQSEMLGEKNTFVSAGKYKVEGNMYEPLSEEATAAMQGMVDAYYQSFLKAVARGRGVSVSAVEAGYGQGRVLTAQAAKSAGLVDRIATLDQTIQRLSTAQGRATVGKQKAEGSEWPVATLVYSSSPEAQYQPEPYAPEPDELVQCPSCQKMNDSDANYCDQCGFDLTSTGFEPAEYEQDPDETVMCPQCKRANADDARYCDQCGYQLEGSDALAEDPEPAEARPNYEIERLRLEFAG